MAVCIHNVIAHTCTRCNFVKPKESADTSNMPRPTIIVNSTAKDYVSHKQIKQLQELLASYRSSLDQIKEIATLEMDSVKNQHQYNTWTKVRILSE